MPLSGKCFVGTYLFSGNLIDISSVVKCFSELNFPPWFFVVLLILFFLYRVFARWLKHKERINKENTKRHGMTMSALTETAKSNDLSKSIRAIWGVQEKKKVTSNHDFQIKKIQDEYWGYIIGQARDELPNKMSPAESAPVCKPKGFKQINFSKKRSKT